MGTATQFSFKIKDKDFSFSSISGEVLEVSNTSNVEVSSTSSDEYSPLSGWQKVPKIQSKTVNKCKLWIKTDDDHEHSINIEGFNVPVRVGHKVTIVYFTSQSGTKLASIYNHKTKQQIEFFDGNDIKKLYAIPFGLLYPVIGAPILFFMFAKSNITIASLLFITCLVGGVTLIGLTNAKAWKDVDVEYYANLENYLGKLRL